MTTAYAETPFMPGPDTPAVDPALVVASYDGAIARYGDRVWPLAPLVDNPSAARESILWNNFPQAMREEFRYIAWHMVNRALPDTFRVGKAPSWRTRQGASALYRTVLKWRAFAIWLGKRGITTLAACTEEVFHDYGLSLARATKADRSTVGHHLAALTRLWAFDDSTALPRGIAEPPWISKGRDDYLPAATAVTGENSTEPLDPATVGPLLIWALRVIDDFADDILAGWAENRRITTQARQAVATRETLAAVKQYLRGLAEHRRPVPTYDLPGGGEFALAYISSLTGAPTYQITNVLRTKKIRALKQYLDSNPGSCPMSVPVAGRVEGKPWKQALDYTEAAALMRHLGTAAFIVMSYLTGMRPQEVLGLRTGCCPDPESGQHLINGHIYKTATDEDGNHRSEGLLRDVPWVAITPVVNAIRVLERIVDYGALLFDGTSHDFINRRKLTGSVTLSAWRERIEDFAAWVSGLATDLERPHEIVPADPHGAIGTERFRRTLACARLVTDRDHCRPWPGITGTEQVRRPCLRRRRCIPALPLASDVHVNIIGVLSGSGLALPQHGLAFQGDLQFGRTWKSRLGAHANRRAKLNYLRPIGEQRFPSLEIFIDYNLLKPGKFSECFDVDDWRSSNLQSYDISQSDEFTQIKRIRLSSRCSFRPERSIKLQVVKTAKARCHKRKITTLHFQVTQFQQLQPYGQLPKIYVTPLHPQSSYVHR